MSLRIFADPAGFSSGARLCPLLIPWGEEFTGSATFPFSQDAYARTGRDYFTRTGAADCDLVVCPVAWQGEQDDEVIRRLAGRAKAIGKPLVVFCETDSEEPFPVPGALVFRGSMRRSRKLPVEMAAPAFIRDHLANLDATARVRARPKADSPVVGFCGNIDTTANSGVALKRLLARAVYWGLLSRPALEGFLRRCGLRITRSEGKRTRYQALGVVSRCSRIQKNIQLREHFLDGTLLLPKEEQTKHLERSFAGFRENVLGSDYTLCPRGGGNWSYRFYETLCLGRVPVFFNTDCVLPYESFINWRDYCVWVESDSISQTAEAILHHYESHTPGSFVALQQRCRQLWLDYLSLDGFFRNFHRHLELRLGQP
jgi:hypothetical protein